MNNSSDFPPKETHIEHTDSPQGPRDIVVENEGREQNIDLVGEAARTPLESETSIETLAEALGFIETDELRQLRALIIETSDSQPDEVAQLLARYRLLGEQVVEMEEGDDYASAQIGLILAIGTIKHSIGRIEDYIAELEDALLYADNLGYERASHFITATLNSLIGGAHTAEQI